MATFYVPAVNLIGKGVVNEVGPYIKELGYKKALLVTDKFIEGSDILPKVLKPLDAEGIEYVIFSDVEPNPTCKNVTDGVAALKEHGCDFIISLGGGSPQDAASCISIIATNGGKPQDYEGLHKSAKKGLPVVAINTTAGTSAEITINYVITDVEKKRKFVCVDTHDIPVVAFVDPDMMSSMPKGLTASTGMDALTHAIEGYTTKGANTITDMFNLKAIELIAKSLRGAVENTAEGREGMALGQYLTGMGFSNCGLGIVHSMAHGLGALYDTPHGVANAIILPTVMEYNKEAVGEKLREVAKAMGVSGTEKMSKEEYQKAAIDAVKKLAEDVGIPKDLKNIVKPEDVDFLSQSAMDDACRPGNPRDPKFEEIKELFLSLL